ncbi:MAG: NAD(P)H-hydrate dehydratase [Lysobacter sp.]|nr:NAD(P)H-hydrate dehydratase [Lysobacter sp.]
MSDASNLYDRNALRVLETQATAALGGDAFELMRRAGQAAWGYLLQHWPDAQRIAVVCGPGNNGGDGYVLARHAQQAGRDVCVICLAGHVPHGKLAVRACSEYESAGGRIESFAEALPRVDVIVDALFGIGLSRAPEADTVALIDAINRHAAPVFSLDVPSGIDSDNGHARSAAVNADRTLQFIAAHCGLQTGDALDRVGERAVATLDIPDAAFDGVQPAAKRSGAEDLAIYLPPRLRNAHKGSYGHVLCIGGDDGMGGAIALCAEAALRTGAGLVSVATRHPNVVPLLVRRPEAMAHGVDSADDLQVSIQAASVVALGPGLGRSAWSRALFSSALVANKSIVIDADALNLLAELPRALPAAILTPHPGEAARLLGVSTADIQADRYAAAQSIAEKYKCTIVLKGAGTIVVSPNQTPFVIAAGNPGMASGGMGDVLTGVIAALRAQGLPAFDAAHCGALLHALAGDAAADSGGERGMIASDLFPQLRTLANPEPVQQ